MEGYGVFASVYDKLTENVPYDEIAAYYDGLIKELGGGGLLADIGCGTGNLTVRMAQKGYDVIGADASAEMLSVAYSKPHEGVQYICQSMTELELYGAADVIISTLDSINHLGSADDISACFAAVYDNLADGGLFLFDVNTVYKHRGVLGDNTFVYEAEGIYCVWQNEYSPENSSVEIQLDLFFENEDGSYERETECFSEIALEREELEELLRKAGFRVLGVYEYLTHDAPRENSEKLLFAAGKA